jgi:hypothetical protein
MSSKAIHGGLSFTTAVMGISCPPPMDRFFAMRKQLVIHTEKDIKWLVTHTERDI